jgi:MbtH protein
MGDNNSKVTVNVPDNNPEETVELHLVLKNREEQYSLWPDYKEVPIGWKSVFGPKPKEDCLRYVKKNWTDMRPLSLRKKMAEIEVQDQTTRDTCN